MAAGVIPIMADTVEDYTSELRDVEPIVMVHERNANAVASEVLRIEEGQIDSQILLENYKRVFDQYFDHERYVDALSTFLIDSGP
jgi:hypothetical protein